ncbi:f-box domain-containing protein [Rutstroemia sp. NJR-2017a WRK4]|nr:f-box domain-containing protein [Rutstroemia sp. NJR-2017a WRK4]
MVKRRRSSTCSNDLQINKKPRGPSKRDYLSNLSSELLVRILHNLPIETLLCCHSVSRRFYTLSNDSQLWKSLYYARFVLPRVLRIPGIKHGGTKEHDEMLRFSSRRSRWLDDEGLRNPIDGKETNWKRQYKLRHNWARGACEVQQIDIAAKRVPSMMVRLAGGVLLTLSVDGELSAWGLKERKPIMRLKLEDGWVPTCFAVDEQEGDKGRLGVVVGFKDGGWGTHPPSSNGMLSAVAYASPYVLSITKDQLLSFYTLTPPSSTEDSEDNPKVEQKERPTRPYLLTSLKSHSSWPPLSLSIRLTPSAIIASIAYTLPTYLSGYTISIQELHFSHSSSASSVPILTISRLTSSVPHGFQPLTSSPHSNPTPLPRPTTISYAHPYILATHPDNTLSLYLCTSTSTSLSLSPPQKLYGHTSAISFASITARGKAVSVSGRGGELRVWELEPARSGKGSEERSVQILADDDGCGAEGETEDEADVVREMDKKHWVGFDEEMVIVLKESGVAHGDGDTTEDGGAVEGGQQRLVIYDFT